MYISISSAKKHDNNINMMKMDSPSAYEIEYIHILI